MAQPPTSPLVRPAPASNVVALTRTSPVPVPPRVALDWRMKVADEPAERAREAIRRALEYTAPLAPLFALMTLKPEVSVTAPIVSEAATLARP